ncbi:hypothetical protein ACTXT7_015495 [Hymenolepis weldensis]
MPIIARSYRRLDVTDILKNRPNLGDAAEQRDFGGPNLLNREIYLDSASTKDPEDLVIKVEKKPDVKVHNLVDEINKFRSLVADSDPVQDRELRVFNPKEPKNDRSLIDRRDPIPSSKSSDKCKRHSPPRCPRTSLSSTSPFDDVGIKTARKMATKKSSAENLLQTTREC